MKELKNEIKDVPVKDLHQFGLLKFELEQAEMKILSENKFNQVQLLFFEKDVVALEFREVRKYINTTYIFRPRPGGAVASISGMSLSIYLSQNKK